MARLLGVPAPSGVSTHLPLEIEADGHVLRLFSVTSRIGSESDVTLRGQHLETSVPADDRTPAADLTMTDGPRRYHHRVATQDLTERELDAWRTSFQMFEWLRARIERQLQRDSGLSLADYAVLSLLSEAPEKRMRIFELARAAGWEKSRLHHQLTRMTKRGLVDRQPCGSRGMEAVITAKGMDVIKEAAPSHSRQVRELFVDRLTPEQLDQFAGLAGIILEKLGFEQGD